MSFADRLNLIVAGVVITLLSATASAGVTGAKIQSILIYDGGPLVYVYPVGGVANPPACHGTNGNYYSFSLRREFAKEYLAGLLAAQATGATVTFYGTGACTDQTVSETLSYFTVISQ